MNEEDRAKLKQDYPNHYFTRVVGFGISVLMAIPKSIEPKKRGLFDCAELLHGATITLNWKPNGERAYNIRTGEQSE